VAVFVYGIVRGRHRLGDPPPGVGAGRVRLAASGPLAAVVSDVDDTAAEHGLPDADTGRYLDVLVAVLDGGPVLPVRFPTLARHDEEVRGLLADAGPAALAERLDEIDGRVEIRVDVVVDVDRVARELLATSPNARELARLGRSGPTSMPYRLELGRQISDALVSRRVPVAEALTGTLGPLADGFTPLDASDVTRTRYAFMLDRRAMPELDAAIRRLRGDLGADYDVECVGPLPLFDFAGPVTPGRTRRPAPESG
jgi:hypothetical protein